jgi:hypothetical protein
VRIRQVKIRAMRELPFAAAAARIEVRRMN